MPTLPLIDPWTSLEIAKLIVGILTPLSVAAFGWFVSRRLKQLDLVLWNNQKLIEKRLAVYDAAAPLLNKLLCFYTWVGYWKSISPEDVIAAKRELDRTLNIYRHLFDDEVYERYQAFIHTLFETYSGPGHDARIRSVIDSPDGDGNRKRDGKYGWTSTWDAHFSDPAKKASNEDVRAGYERLMNELTRSLGVVRREP
jgi:hypothetical protein